MAAHYPPRSRVKPAVIPGRRVEPRQNRRMPTRREFLRLAGAFAASGAASGGFGWLFRRVGAVGGALAATPSAVGVICKDAWDAAPVGAAFQPHSIERLTVHHTAATLSTNTLAPRRIRGHQAHHRAAGWPDLAYHFVVDARGHVYEGRPVAFRGDTFTSYDPSGHFLVSCEGDFDRHGLPAAQLAGLVDVLAWASAEFGAGVGTIGGHRDYASTSCPGAALYPLIADGALAGMVADRLAAGGAALVPVCGERGEALVAAIETGADPLGPAPPGGEPAPGRFHLRHANAPGPADQELPFGASGWAPVQGRFGELP